jgi:CRP-like cAMP-binding protein
MTMYSTESRLVSMLQHRLGERLSSCLDRVLLPRGRVLHHANTPIQHVYFVETGLVSVMANTGSGSAIEVWLIGPEGMAGVPVIFGEAASAHRRIVHVDGQALRMKTADFRRLMDDAPEFRSVMLSYAYLVLFQTSQTGACNATHPLEQRLARWLLLAEHRCGGGELPITQQVLSRMLGVRRATVTQCIASLEKKGALQKSRGSLSVTDREVLASCSCHCYRAIQSKYDRLFQREIVAPSRRPAPVTRLQPSLERANGHVSGSPADVHCG